MNDPAFKKYDQFIVLRDKLVKEIRKQAKYLAKMRGKDGTYRLDQNVPIDAMTMVDKYKVRVCK